MKLAIISNVNINILTKKLKKKYDVYEPEGYGNYVEELLNKESGLNKFCADIVFILLDGNTLIEKYCDIEKAYRDIDIAIRDFGMRNKKTEIFLSNIDIYNPIKQYIDTTEDDEYAYLWNKFIRDTEIDINIFNLLDILKRIGRDNFYSNSLWYLSSTKFSNKAINSIVYDISNIVDSKTLPRKKCLVLDLDNTLWGGVLGEEGYDGIAISQSGEGKVYYEFQREIKKLKEIGIILAIVSKNNIDDVLEAFEHNKNLVLKKEDFIIIKANWNDKYDNMLDIASELNIGLDSMVFIDDNPLERELVRLKTDEVIVPEFPTNIYNIIDFIQKIYYDYFFTYSLTYEDRNKLKQYRDNAIRNEAKLKYNNYRDYINSLDIKLYMEKVEEDYERASQLTQKTNQFNLTTKRYTQNDLIDLKEKGYVVLMGRVQDKYGDYGNVILIIYHIKNNTMIIDAFLMSCRVMGKEIEKRALDYIENIAREYGIYSIIASYKKTKKNVPASEFYKNNDYVLLEQIEDEYIYIKGMG